ncbi:MAG: asparagine synthase (glutamine-hydrolyzing), partial [Aliifodinibius sp.]|nr:asparagine synthase (glutamine-hydrolyzing) [Fodinibius sp.]NIV12096.1 asparagine synthase (glutamine-hydrolyzing) [Fodinibius sp.]NIY25726.1 asparagine synthase (glutamine-hydrolyzing) [Fodinibius sp.]
ALAHRGPDDEGIYTDKTVGLGHKRLSIIDLKDGHQPMTNEDESLWIVYNGEIYNYVELRRDLKRDHRFRTHSDTEVILHLYEELGERCLERLNGMFSFAIWDSRQQRLFAARDRLGIKPFYWFMDNNRFVFASEPKAMIAAGILKPQPDPHAIEEYLTFQFCLGDRTLFKDIWRLEPGHYLTFRPHRDSQPSIVCYWDFNYEIDTHHTEDYFIDQLLYLLQDSINLRLRSDVPVGGHLSGGIDSSTVVCLAAPNYSGDFHTFTGGFREGSQYDETKYAQLVAKHVQSVHHEFWPTAQDFSEIMPWLIYMMDEPAAGPGIFPQYFLSKIAREHVKVVLGGQGGDETFGGYARYLIAYLEQCLKGAIYGNQEEGRFVVTWDSIMPNLKLLQQYQPLLQTFWRDGLFEEMDRRYFKLVSRIDNTENIFTTDFWSRESQARVFSTFQQIFNNPSTKSYFDKMTNFDLNTLLPALLHVEDRTSMSVSLESRVPLLDYRIVELVTKMSPLLRFKGGDTKRIFREAVRHLLPEEIFNRKDKMGFPVPLTEWFKGE